MTDAYARFLKSMQIDYVKWHDGDGYDLEALAQLTTEEKSRIEALLIERMNSTPDWRDLEALKTLATPTAMQVIRKALHNSDSAIRLHAADYLADAGDDSELEHHIIDALHQTILTGPAGRALDMAAEHPTPQIREALLEVALNGKDEAVRVNAAGLAMFLAGKSKEAFDWDFRPLFLRFGNEDRAARQAAYDELVAMMGEK